MKTLCKFLIIGFGSLFSLNSLLAQQIRFSPEVYSAGGGHFSNATFSLSYTIGELALVSTAESGNVTLTQGFHQPDKFTIDFIPDLNALVQMQLFPNPVSELVHLQFNAKQPLRLKLEVMDAAGRLVLLEPVLVLSPEQQIYTLSVNTLSAGMYHLRVLDLDSPKQSTYRFSKLYY